MRICLLGLENLAAPRTPAFPCSTSSTRAGPGYGADLYYASCAGMHAGLLALSCQRHAALRRPAAAEYGTAGA